MLAKLDQSDIESYLLISESVVPAPRSAISRLPLPLRYDPDDVLRVMNDIWPSRRNGHLGRGRKPVDRLAVVCFIIHLCDPEHGFVPNLLEAHRRLQADGEYRAQLGFTGRLPSYSVFRNTAELVLRHWDDFRDCQVPEGSSVRRWMAVLSQELGVSTSVEKAGRKYSRDWAAYNGACTHEVTDVKHLLGGFSDLINLIEMGLQGFRGKGRPPFPLGHAGLCYGFEGLFRPPVSSS